MSDQSQPRANPPPKSPPLVTEPRAYPALVDEVPLHQEDDDYSQVLAILRIGLPILAIVIATAVLYFGRDILLPLAMATMLSVIFSPVAGRLEKIFGRLAGTALVVFGAIAMVGGITYYLTTELTSVADDLTGYSDNIANKLTALQKNTPAGLQRIELAIEDVERRVAAANPKQVKVLTRQVEAVPQSSLGDDLKPFAPVLSGLGDPSVLFGLVFFR